MRDTIRHHHAEKKGMIGITTVIVIGAFILIVGLSMAYQGQTEIILTGYDDRAAVALSLASTCVDEALNRLQTDASYAGGTVPIDADSCTSVVSGSGTTRTIVATASSDVNTKTISVSASLRQNAAGDASAWHIDSWTEQDPP